MTNIDKSTLLAEFRSIYEDSHDTHIYFAPGRVNLIGEHTDYNGGYVLPCALTLGTYAVVLPRRDDILRLYSMNFPEQGVVTLSMSNIEHNPAHGWANYPKSVIWALKDSSYNLDKGADILYYGNIPNGSGLSSSASIEVLTAYVMCQLHNLDIDMTKLALLCQRAENDYIGVSCGIMDQFAIAMGRENCAIFLNTDTLDHKYVPITLGDYKLIIMNTNKKRTLADSKYNERRSQCENALNILNHHSAAPFRTLCELTPDEFYKICHYITDETLLRRARHVITENFRTKLATQALSQGDLQALGALMSQSHSSLKDDYEVTGPELDTLVNAAMNYNEQQKAHTPSNPPAVLGARMTGAGFGGCAIALVHSALVSDFIANTGKDYLKTIGYAADFYVATSSNGPGKL